jgi:hypothetical protein
MGDRVHPVYGRQAHHPMTMMPDYEDRFRNEDRRSIDFVQGRIRDDFIKSSSSPGLPRVNQYDSEADRQPPT